MEGETQEMQMLENFRMMSANNHDADGQALKPHCERPTGGYSRAQLLLL